MILAKLYLKYRNLDVLQKVLKRLRPAVIAMIASAGVSILVAAFFGEGAVTLSNISWLMVSIFIICYVLLAKVRMNPIVVMVLAGVLNLVAGMAGI